MPELCEMESENMTNHRQKPGLLKTWLPVAGALLIAVILFFSGALDKQKVWENMTDPDDREQVYLDAGMALDADSGKNYGAISRGPYLDLPAGSYRLSWYIWGDGENRIHLVSSNGARIDREMIPVPAGGGKGEASFTLLDEADRFEIQVEFVQGSRIKVEDIRLYSPKYKDPAFFLLLMVIALSAAWIAFCRGVRLSNRTGCMLIAFALLFSCAPFLKDDLIILHDIKFHIPRICNLADGLRSGQFPVRAGGYTYNGYGAITSAFYPDFFLIPFALMLLGGASCQFVFSLLLIGMNIASAFSMYMSAKRILKDAQVATLAAALYVLSPYRNTDVYVRGAVGEGLAMIFVPLFIMGLLEVIRGDERKWPWLTLSAASVFLSHMLSCLMCAILAFALCLLYIRDIMKPGRLLSLCRALLWTVVLCLFQIVPMVGYLRQQIGADMLLVTDIRKNMSSLGQLLILGEGSIDHVYLDPGLTPVPVETGVIPLLGLFVVAYLWMERRPIRDRSLVLRMSLLSGLFLVMQTSLFPWGRAVQLSGGILGYLQFAWRFATISSPLLCYVAACGWKDISREYYGRIMPLLLALCVVQILPSISIQTRRNEILTYGTTTSSIPENIEYLIPGTDITRTVDRSLFLQDVDVTKYEKDGTRITCQVESPGGGSVEFPLFAYDGYAAWLNGQELPVTRGDNNRIRIELPADTKGSLSVAFRGKGFWKAFDLLSLAGLLRVLALCTGVCGRRKGKNPA